MSKRKHKTNVCPPENILLLSSKEEFVKEYRKFFFGKPEARELYYQILSKFENIISRGKIDELIKLSNFLEYITGIETQSTLRNYYEQSDNPIKTTNLIILSSKYNQLPILEFLFIETKILNNLSVYMRRNILPDDVDDEHHNAFYYAMRSGNVDFLKTLINKWPGDYFAIYPEKLEDTLSKSYEELKLKNVALLDKVDIFVQSKLINIRFGKGYKTENTFDNIKERIELVLENISSLNSHKSEVDDIFLFTAKSIAKNVHILKHQLKSTYDRIPWEEIEFCIIAFISSHLTHQEINLFYRFTLDKNILLNHLESFAETLEDLKSNIESIGIKKLASIPKSNRETVVKNIIGNYPKLAKLYQDYKEIRDIYSLKKIDNYVKLAASADSEEKEGQLVIIRVLQVVGEHLKNTLQSPKLSNTISDFLLLSLPINVRKAIIELRNSISHAYSLSERMEIEAKANINFFSGIKDEIKKIGKITTEMLYKKQVKTIVALHKKIIESKNKDEIMKIAAIVNNLNFLEEKINNVNLESFATLEVIKLESLIDQLNKKITEKSDVVRDLFSKINNIITTEKNKFKDVKFNYNIGLIKLHSFSYNATKQTIDDNVIRTLKYFSSKILENFTPKIERNSLKEIAELSQIIYHKLQFKTEQDCFCEIQELFCQIFFIAEFETDSIRFVDELKEQLKNKSKNTRKTLSKEECNKQLRRKTSDLKKILKNNGLDELDINIAAYKRNKRLHAAVEMLVLDIMTILSDSNKYVKNNQFFLDDDFPILTGKCLRNHLAHDNAIVEIMLSDFLLAIILNAKELSSENIFNLKKHIDRTVEKNSLKNKYEYDLAIVNNQQEMFSALEKNNKELFKNCLKQGADIKGRNIYLYKTIHFASKGSSLEVLKFLLNNNVCADVKDINGQTPLHISAACGRASIVDFFVKEINLDVDVVDNLSSTPLHLAAQNNHTETVKVLLTNKANTNIKDQGGNSPVHHAAMRNHKEVVEFLLEKELNVDSNETLGGFTPLHAAAETGSLDVVNFLLQKKANVNAKNDWGGIPLHTAALNGHLEVVNILLSKGADVNSTVIGGCTSLHFAVETGHDKVVEILLKYGADVDVKDRTYNNTPLHYAAQSKNEAIVNLLLTYKANPNIATVDRMIPLHLAAENGHLEIVKSFLNMPNVDVNAKTVHGFTPLHLAAKNGHEKIVDCLITNKAKINDRAKNNLTPLHLVGGKETAILLIQNKAEINARTNDGLTPLHTAVLSGNRKVVDLLIRNKAQVNFESNKGVTPLHLAATGAVLNEDDKDYKVSINNYIEIVQLLIKNNARINVKDLHGITPISSAVSGGHTHIVDILIKNNAEITDELLYIAVEFGHTEIVDILIVNRKHVNTDKLMNSKLLFSAVKHNNKEIVDLLLANGADVNAIDGTALTIAATAGFKDLVKHLIQNGANVRLAGGENALHSASIRGNTDIASILIKKGADVNATTIQNAAPLHFATENGREGVVKVLLNNGADINSKTSESITALHNAAMQGYDNIVKVLLEGKIDTNIRDHKNRTAVQLAIAHGHLQVVRTLVHHDHVDVNAKDNFPMLHIAAQKGYLDITKFLIEAGANINITNNAGSKPIHIAAREGHKKIVEFYFTKGLHIDDLGAANQTLLHYAAIKNQLQVAKYLISQGINVNTKDFNGETATHIAARHEGKDIIELLLHNGGIYNSVNRLNKKPLDITTNKHIIKLLTSTHQLFEAVKQNNISETEKSIHLGALINAKNIDNVTALHYAAWKGYDKITHVLLENKGNPNVKNDKGVTPLHYAAKFSHLKIVKSLLSNGAIYNTVSASGKKPLDFATQQDIADLFTFLDKAFNKIKNGDSMVLNDLKKIKNLDTVKAVMNARNVENRTIIETAIANDFPKVKQLKVLFQDNLPAYTLRAQSLILQENYQEVLNIYKTILENRIEILGPDNPGTLDIQEDIAKMFYKLHNYQEALSLFDQIYQKQKKLLGINSTDTLNTRRTIALVLHRQGKNDEALNKFKEVYRKQKEILGTSDLDTLETQSYLGLVLESLGEYEEALNLNYEVFEKYKQIFGLSHPRTLCVQNNTAMVLNNMGKHDEAMKMYQETYELRKKVLGPVHSDTLRTLHNMVAVLIAKKKYSEGLIKFEEVYNTQKAFLGQHHLDTLDTKFHIANILFKQGKFIAAFKNYKETFDQRKGILGANHPSVILAAQSMDVIKIKFQLNGNTASDILNNLQKDINIAASSDNIEKIHFLFKGGADVNDKDPDGRTPLHFAIGNGHITALETLLQNKADVTEVTNKGNTPLHIAVSKGYKEIVEILLKHINRSKLNHFVNAKTITNGTTALHVAAKNGFAEIVKLLLKYGATYNIENKEQKTPLDLSDKNREVTHLLKLIGELFKFAKNGNIQIIDKLKSMKNEELEILANVRNDQGNTLLQVAIINKRINISSELIKIMKNID